MKLSKLENKGTLCALVNCENTVITDTQSALDLLMNAKYDIGTKNIVISKQLITEDFFVLSTGLAGEILQKFVNYGGRIAIYGDYSHYTSKPLRQHRAIHGSHLDCTTFCIFFAKLHKSPCQ